MEALEKAYRNLVTIAMNNGNLTKEDILNYMDITYPKVNVADAFLISLIDLILYEKQVENDLKAPL